MNTIKIILTLLVFMAPITATGAPFLVCDPQPNTDWYKVTIAQTGEVITVPYGNYHESGAVIILDFAEQNFEPGEVGLQDAYHDDVDRARIAVGFEQYQCDCG